MSIFPNIIGATFAIALLSGTASAGEPLRLSDTDLDGVTASGFAGFALAFTTGVVATGNVVNSSEVSSASYSDNTVITNTSFTPDIKASSNVNIRTTAIGVGATSASGGGGMIIGFLLF